MCVHSTELVDRLLRSLIAHRALGKIILSTFVNCDMTSLSLATCKNVQDDWLAPLARQSLIHLDLSRCSSITDMGLLQLHALHRLKCLSLKSCLGIKDRGLHALTFSRQLISLDLMDCRNLTDEGIKNIAHLSYLEHLHLAGCHLLTDQALQYISELIRLRTLNVNQCCQLTGDGLSSCLPKLSYLQSLDLGHCLCVLGSSDFFCNSITPGVELVELVLDKLKISEEGKTS